MFGQLGLTLGTGITAVVLVGVAALLAVIGWFQGRGARESQRWNTTEGEVMDATVIQYSHETHDGTMLAYRPRIIYGYRICGRDYVSERLNFGTGVHSSIRAFAENKAKKFPVGSKVQVFYDPQNPNEATLERSAPGSRVMYLVAGIMLLIALMMVMFGAGLGVLLGRIG